MMDGRIICRMDTRLFIGMVLRPPRPLTLPEILTEAHTVDDKDPACPYTDLIYQKSKNSGSVVHIYIYKVMQDFNHQQYGGCQWHTPWLKHLDGCTPGWASSASCIIQSYEMRCQSAVVSGLRAGYLFLNPHLDVYLYLYLYLSTYLPIYISIYISMSSSRSGSGFSLSSSLSLSPSPSLPLSLSLCLSVHTAMHTTYTYSLCVHFCMHIHIQLHRLRGCKPDFKPMVFAKKT